MGKKSPPPKAPDLTPITNAQLQIAKESNELAREYLGLSREQFAFYEEQGREELAFAREQADRLMAQQDRAYESDESVREMSKRVGEKQIESMDLQMDYARRDRERYDNVLVPMQDRYIDEANTYDTEARRESEASRATVDVQRAAEAARATSDARMRSMGLDPSQMRSASLLDTQNVALAAQQAGSANSARTMVEDKGRAMRADAMNVISGLPAQSLAGYGSASAAGAGALGAAAAGQQATLGAITGGAGVSGTAMGFRSGALSNLAQLTGSPTQWASMGGNMLGQSASTYGSAANTASQNFQNQMSSWEAGQKQAQQGFQNIMSVASMAGGLMMAEGGAVTPERIDMAIGPVERERIGFDSGFTPSMPVEYGALAKSTSRSMDKGIQHQADRIARRTAQQKALFAAADQSGNVYEDAPYRPQPLLTQQMRANDYRLSMAEGGAVAGPIPVRQQRDRYQATLGEGEYVVPEDVVRAKGVEFFDKLVAKYHREGA